MPLPHLLFIDDDALLRRTFARVLGREFAVVCVADAETAVAALDAGAIFDVLLCDLHLPGLSGQDLYEHLKLRPDETAARLVIITGAGPAEEDAFGTTMRGRFLTKPCSAPHLAATLRMVAFPRVSSPPVEPLSAA